MEHKIDDISFKLDTLESIDLNQLKANSFVSDHLFIILKSNNKPFLVLRAGQIITTDFIKKYSKKTIFKLNLNKKKSLLDLKKCLIDLKDATDELSRIDLSKKLLTKSLDIINDNEQSIVGVAIELANALYCLPKKNILEQFSHSSDLNHRSLVVSTMTILLALEDGHVSWSFLCDIFTISFHLDSGLYASKDLSHHLMIACEKERVASEGRKYLEETTFYEGFINHPIESYKFLKKSEAFFKNKKIIEIVKFHHESEDGSGFPQGTNHEVLSSAEEYLSIADKVISFNPKSFMSGDGKEFLLSYQQRTLKLKSFAANKFSQKCLTTGDAA